MPICTCLQRDQHTQPTSDAEINELLAAVQKATGEDWRVCERVIEVRRWFRKPLIIKKYSLYHETIEPEYQIINLYRPERLEDGSINTINEASHVAAYLYGVLAGVQSCCGEPQGENDA